jgi:hypothetical protein
MLRSPWSKFNVFVLSVYVVVDSQGIGGFVFGNETSESKEDR